MPYRYSPTARTLHWLTALLVFVMFALGIAMVYLVPDSEQALSHRLYNTHESLGVVILLVVVLRLIRRWRHPPGKLPPQVPRIFHVLGHANHTLLYILLLAQPVIGLLRDNAGGFQVVWFEIVALPTLIGKHAALGDVLSAVHWYGAVLIALLIGAHIGAALFHGVIRRDGVLQRMLQPGASVPAAPAQRGRVQYCRARRYSGQRLQRLMRAIQQPREEPRLFRRLCGLDGLLFLALFGRKLALLAVEPFLQAHAGLGSAPGLVGTLSLGQGLAGLQGTSSLLARGFAATRRRRQGPGIGKLPASPWIAGACISRHA
jgi:cytochrome b561